jgi:hypothetical protein
MGGGSTASKRLAQRRFCSRLSDSRLSVTKGAGSHLISGASIASAGARPPDAAAENRGPSHDLILPGAVLSAPAPTCHTAPRVPTAVRRRYLNARVAAGVVAIAVACAVWIPSAQAAGPPEVEATWATDVAATSATVRAQTNANGLTTTLRFEYLTEAAYQANLAAAPPREGFAGAPRSGSGALSGLTPATTYRYRAIATNSAAPAGVPGSVHSFTTEETAAIFSLLDHRGWELVSPIDKNGGAVQGPGANFGGDVLQAAAQGGSVTYSSSSSFGEGANGAPAASQYLAGRGGSGWSAQNITSPQRSGAEPEAGAGVPYRIFSPDLSSALFYSGGKCLSPGVGCANPSPPLSGSGALPGYQDYYLRDNADAAFQALVTSADAPALTLSSEAFAVSLAGVTPDLQHVVLASCAKLTGEATEVPDGPGCNPAEANLYEWSGAALRLVNLLPGETHGTPGARLAAQVGAISFDGSRVYFTDGEDSPIYLREAAGPTKLLPESEGGTEVFQAASDDGSIAFFTKGGTLFRFDAATEASEPLASGVNGVLGASGDGSIVYYQASAGLFRWAMGAVSEIAPGPEVAEPVNYPPTMGAARVSADGSHLLFSSSAPLTGFDNTNSGNGEPVEELFLYDAASHQLDCVSCNPTNERPIGSASVPGAIANGVGALATQTYKPRALSADGSRVFFESADALTLQDTNNRPDVYEWEADGVGGCETKNAVNGGCVALISSGRDPEPSEFIDASDSGGDVFIRTAASLIAADPGSYDLYDAREGGGFAVPPSPIPCEGDSCQPLPSPPEDPQPGTLVPEPHNPPLHFTPGQHRHHRGKKNEKGKRRHRGHHRSKRGGR